MEILKLHFYLLVCCGAAEGYTDKPVDLGQNVTLDCEVAVKDVLWFLMKPSEPPVFILRSYASQALTAEYGNLTLNKTFLLRHNGSLFIHNISTDKLGVYYCIQPGTPYINSGIRLYLHNHSAENQTADKCEEVRLWRILFILLGIIICLAGAAVATACRCKRSPETRSRPPDADIQLPRDNGVHVYDEVQMDSCARTTHNLDSTYALLQPANPCPGSTPSTWTSRDVSSYPERGFGSSATDS